MKRRFLTTADIQTILTNFRVGTLVRRHYIDGTIENQNYKIVTTKGVYLLKVFGDAHVPAKDIVFQNNFMTYLRVQRLKVPKVIPTQSSETVIEYAGKPVSVYQFVEGAHITKFTKQIVTSLAKEIAKLHTVLLNYKLPKEHQNTYYSVKAQGFVKGKKLRSTLLHGDLGTDNILMRGSRVTAIIDFNNLHWSYLINDLATFALVFASKQNLKYIPLFFAEYEKHLKLTPDEKASLHFFMTEHTKGVLRWLEAQAKQKRGKQLTYVKKTKIAYTKKLALLKQNRITII